MPKRTQEQQRAEMNTMVDLHFSDTKQAKTREGRIEKYSQAILAGKGFRDR